MTSNIGSIPLNEYLEARKEWLKQNFQVHTGKGMQAEEYKRIREILGY